MDFVRSVTGVLDQAAEPPSAPPAPAAIAVRSRWPVYAEDEIAAVVEVLRSGRVNSLNHGDNCRAFEAAFAAICGMPHALALANGTLALELALHAFGIGAGDEVVVTPRSFIASAACVVTAGATPVFADVDPVSQNLTARSIARALTPRTRAIIVVHLAGWPCAMDEIMTLAQDRGIKLIEDCAQAHGATYRGRAAGSFGDAAAFSFCTDKIVSTGGEGGLLALRDDAAAARAWSKKDHGKNYAETTRVVTTRTFRWLHESIGSNYRMTEMQAAIGLQQLRKLPAWVERRRANARVLERALAGHPAIRLTPTPNEIGHAYYKYYAFVQPDRLHPSWSRDRLVEALNAAGVPAVSGTCPEIYREQAFAGAGSRAPLPIAQLLGETSLMLPVDPTLDTAAMERIGSILRDLLDQAMA